MVLTICNDVTALIIVMREAYFSLHISLTWSEYLRYSGFVQEVVILGRYHPSTYNAYIPIVN